MTSTVTPSIRLPGLREEIPVIYADAHLLVLDKPARLLVAPDRWDHERLNLSSLIRAAIAGEAAWCRARQIRYAANAHRIDQDTTGLMVFALSRDALTSLVQQFRERGVEKEYLAIVQGAPAADAFTMDLPLRPDDRQPGLMRTVRSGGKVSVTNFEVIERYRDFSLLKAKPQTGRQHQIRIHLKASGHPIVGDEAYGGHPLFLSRLKRKYQASADPERPLIGRQALHAGFLALTHPATGQRLVLRAPLPKDMEVALKYLRRYGAG